LGSVGLDVGAESIPYIGRFEGLSGFIGAVGRW
jgi:hypothetical protein